MQAIEIDLKRITPEEMQQKICDLTIENLMLRDCLKNVLGKLNEINNFAVFNKFVGDMRIAAISNNAINIIENTLRREKRAGND